jgi:hypothetical protein
MSPAFSPTRYVISTRRKAKRELLVFSASFGATSGDALAPRSPQPCTTRQRSPSRSAGSLASHGVRKSLRLWTCDSPYRIRQQLARF